MLTLLARSAPMFANNAPTGLAESKNRGAVTVLVCSDKPSPRVFQLLRGETGPFSGLEIRKGVNVLQNNVLTENKL